MYPLRLKVDNAVTLLQNQNVRNNFRSGIALKGIVRQSNCAKQIRSLCDIFSDSGIFLIHRAFAGNQRHNTARS